MMNGKIKVETPIDSYPGARQKTKTQSCRLASRVDGNFAYFSNLGALPRGERPTRHEPKKGL